MLEPKKISKTGSRTSFNKESLLKKPGENKKTNFGRLNISTVNKKRCGTIWCALRKKMSTVLFFVKMFAFFTLCRKFTCNLSKKKGP